MKARELMDEINKELEVNNDTSEDQPSSMNNSEWGFDMQRLNFYKLNINKDFYSFKNLNYIFKWYRSWLYQYTWK